MFIRFCIIESSGVQRDAPPPLVYAPVDKRTGPADVKRVTSGPKGLEQAHIGGRRGGGALAVTKRIVFSSKRPIFPHACATLS